MAKLPPRRAPPPPKVPADWAAAAAAQAPEPARVAPVGSGFDRVRAEAAKIEPGPMGLLLWVDARCQKAGMHPLDPWWADAFRAFCASGKMIMLGRLGLRAGKSVSVCRALVSDVLFSERKLDPGVVGVAPIMSSDRTEATDRFTTIKAILGAIGVQPAKGEETMGALAGGCASEYSSSTLPSGGGVIRTTDAQGHAIEIRILPAKKTAAVGYTGIGGFCDEVDLWRDVSTGANPADVVLDLLLNRFTTTAKSSRLYIFSATYNPTSAHARLIAEGDTPLQHIARLGEDGAARDDAARLELAASTRSDDPRLLAPADPHSPDVPSWVTNPSTADIVTCASIAKGDVGKLLWRYGGRPQGGAVVEVGDGDLTIYGEPSRYAAETAEDRGYDVR